MNKSLIAILIRERGRRGLRRKPPRAATPTAYEIQYRRQLYGIIKELEDLVRDTLIPALPSLIAERQAELPDNARGDSWVDNIESIMGRVQQLADREHERAVQRALELGGEINNFNRQQQTRIAMATLGVNPFTGAENWLQTELQSFARENAALIKSLTDQNVVQQIEGIAQRTVRGGQSLEDATREIMGRFDVARSRARLIARDQVSKLNGQLTEYRQREIGIETYTWQTAGDGRVRDEDGDSHKAMEGRTCRWDDETVYLDGDEWVPRSQIGGVELHPGEDYQCRCVAIAGIDNLLNDLGL